MCGQFRDRVYVVSSRATTYSQSPRGILERRARRPSQAPSYGTDDVVVPRASTPTGTGETMFYIAPRPLRVCVARPSRAAPRGRDVSVDAPGFSKSSSAPASRSRSRASLVAVTNLQRDVVDL